MKFRTATLLLSLFTFIPLQAEENVTPQWMKNITRLPPGDNANLRPVHLEYTLAWNNRVNAGRLEVSIVKSGSANVKFVADATGGSTGFARVLWPYDFRARSVVDHDSLRPITFQLSEREREDVNSYDIIFEQKRQVYTTRSKPKDEEEMTDTSRFRFDFGQDVLSGAFYLRSQPLKAGEEVSMIVTPFNKPYLAQFRVIGRENHKIKGNTHKAIKLDVRISKINRDLSLKSYEKIKQSTLWIEDDEYRIPLELQTEIPVGFVSARIDGVKWLE